MDEHETKLAAQLIVGVNHYIRSSWHSFQKDNPDASIYETPVAEFLEHLDMRQEDYLKEIGADNTFLATLLTPDE